MKNKHIDHKDYFKLCVLCIYVFKKCKQMKNKHIDT